MGLPNFTCLLVAGVTVLLATIVVAQENEASGQQYLELRRQLGAQATDGDYEKAIVTISQIIELRPNDLGAFVARGEMNYMSGNMEDAVSDFDEAIKLNPEVKPQLWQRGLALYYLERFEDGIEQFEVHQTINGQDVENAAWHFACVAKSSSFDSARENMIPIESDSRVPMMQVHQLFSGTLTPDEVIEAAKKGNPTETTLARNKFYAHFYIGLYYEAKGDTENCQKHMKLAAAEEHRIPNHVLMGQVAKVHLKLRERTQESTPID